MSVRPDKPAGLAANRRRGEVAAMIDGEPRILCLTLGALAELEAAFGVDNIAALAERLGGGRLSAGDLTRILAAGLRGGGNVFTDEEVAAMTVEGGVAGTVRLVGALVAAAFSDGEAVLDP